MNADLNEASNIMRKVYPSMPERERFVEVLGTYQLRVSEHEQNVLMDV